jgi:GNAT superfamily N-acetyltransferase
MNIRDVTSEDAAALAELLQALGYPVAPTDVPARLQRFEGQGNGRVIVAEADNQLVGFAAVEMTFPIHHATPVCHLSAFAIAPSVRRRGIGRQLLKHIERLARQSGCRHVVVTSAEHRSDAHSFYPANGWRYTGRRFGKELVPE